MSDKTGNCHVCHYWTELELVKSSVPTGDGIKFREIKNYYCSPCLQMRLTKLSSDYHISHDIRIIGQAIGFLANLVLELVNKDDSR